MDCEIYCVAKIGHRGKRKFSEVAWTSRRLAQLKQTQPKTDAETATLEELVIGELLNYARNGRLRQIGSARQLRNAQVVIARPEGIQNCSDPAHH